MEKWKDLLGQEINEGDTIAYATRVGNRAAMNVGTVLGYHEEDYYGKPVVSLKVQKTKESGWHFSDRTYKPGYLGCNDRIVVIRSNK